MDGISPATIRQNRQSLTSENLAKPEPDLAADLALLIAEVRVAEAARSRVLERHLRHAAAADATLAGILVDLAERGRPVAVRTTGRQLIEGRVAMVGVDAIAVASTGCVTYIPMRAVVTVSPSSADEPDGDRPPPSRVSFAVIMASLAAARAQVTISFAGETEAVTGELRAAGRDVLTVRLTTRPPVATLIAFEQVAALTVAAYEGGLASG